MLYQRILRQVCHLPEGIQKETVQLLSRKQEVQLVKTQIEEHPAQIGQPIFARNVKIDGTFFVWQSD